MGLAQAPCVPPGFYIVILLQVCLVHILGREIHLHGKDAHILWPSIHFGQGDSRDCRKPAVEIRIKIPRMVASQSPQKTIWQSFHSTLKCILKLCCKKNTNLELLSVSFELITLFLLNVPLYLCDILATPSTFPDVNKALLVF